MQQNIIYLYTRAHNINIVELLQTRVTVGERLLTEH